MRLCVKREIQKSYAFVRALHSVRPFSRDRQGDLKCLSTFISHFTFVFPVICHLSSIWIFKFKFWFEGEVKALLFFRAPVPFSLWRSLCDSPFPLVPLAPFPVVGSEGLSSPLEPVGVTNGSAALPAARSTNSKQSEGGGGERRGVIRKRNEERERTRKRNGGGFAAKDEH